MEVRISNIVITNTSRTNIYQVSPYQTSCYPCSVNNILVDKLSQCSLSDLMNTQNTELTNGIQRFHTRLDTNNMLYIVDDPKNEIVFCHGKSKGSLKACPNRLGITLLSFSKTRSNCNSLVWYAILMADQTIEDAAFVIEVGHKHATSFLSVFEQVHTVGAKTPLPNKGTYESNYFSENKSVVTFKNRVLNMNKINAVTYYEKIRIFRTQY